MSVVLTSLYYGRLFERRQIIIIIIEHFDGCAALRSEIRDEGLDVGILLLL